MIGLLHDVGKIGIADAIINKPSALNDEEYETIKTHPAMGEKILKNITDFPKLMTGARYHHERYDGRGYPDGLSGEDIPVEARIIAVADSYDAMSSRRSYRDVLPQEKIRSEIDKGRGTQFDPVFAKIMLDMIDEDPEYQMRENPVNEGEEIEIAPEELEQVIRWLDEFQTVQAEEQLKEWLGKPLAPKVYDRLKNALIAVEEEFDAERAAEILREEN